MKRPAPRVVALLAIVAVVLTGAITYGVVSFRGQAGATAEPPPTSAELAAVLAVPHVVFRSTATDAEYGTVAVVPLDDLAGPRAYTGVLCDRVAATGDMVSCLRTVPGVATRYEAELYDAATWQSVQSWPLPGIPSRTRLSPDGSHVATTAFVTGHSYASTGFSTQTIVHDLGTEAAIDLEDLTFVVDGARIAPVDRNFWGVTFVDGTTFYATAQSQALGHTWLVRGDLAGGTLTTVFDGGACPSLSPDRTRLAFKTQTSDEPVHWTPSVLDLATGEVTVLSGETRSYDDQIIWLDDDTIAYGIPRQDEPGVTDVWSLDVTPDAAPQLFLDHAWSPQVVRR